MKTIILTITILISGILGQAQSGHSWKDVQLSNIPSEVEGMFKIDDFTVSVKGKSEFSSSAKIQARVIDRAKIQTAMVGGEVCYTAHQNTQGGTFFSTTNASLISIAYTSKKIYKEDLQYGEYRVSEAIVLKDNDYELSDYKMKTKPKFDISERDVYEKSGFLKISNNNIVDDITEWSIINVSDNVVILSGVFTSKKGKSTYYNIFLIKN